MIHYKEYVIKFVDYNGDVRFEEESAANMSDALDRFFRDHGELLGSFTAIYEKR